MELMYAYRESVDAANVRLVELEKSRVSYRLSLSSTEKGNVLLPKLQTHHRNSQTYAVVQYLSN